MQVELHCSALHLSYSDGIRPDRFANHIHVIDGRCISRGSEARFTSIRRREVKPRLACRTLSPVAEDLYNHSNHNFLQSSSDVFLATMDSEDLHSLVEDLAGSVDDLEQSLAPLLNAALSASTSKLPLLDKAKLYVLTTYAIESILFSYLLMNGADAKEHPVFKELSRVKQYFEKIKMAETAGVKKNTTLDKGAAGRFVKHALAGNAKHDNEARERHVSKRKFEDMTERVGTHTRFNHLNDISTEKSGDSAEENKATGSREAPNSVTSKKGRTKRKHAQAEETESTQTIIPRKSKSSKVPKGHSEAFKALLDGPASNGDEKKHRKKKRKDGVE